MTARRLTIACALMFCVSAQAWAGAPEKAKGNWASAQVFSANVSEPPSLLMLALGLIGIGVHGLNRIRQHR